MRSFRLTVTALAALAMPALAQAQQVEQWQITQLQERMQRQIDDLRMRLDDRDAKDRDAETDRRLRAAGVNIPK